MFGYGMLCYWILSPNSTLAVLQSVPVTAGGDVGCVENQSWQLLHQNPDISARFSSMETDFEARSSPEPKMSLVRRKYIHSARFGCVHGRGLGGDYFFPALVKYNNDIQNPTHVGRCTDLVAVFYCTAKK